MDIVVTPKTSGDFEADQRFRLMVCAVHYGLAWSDANKFSMAELQAFIHLSAALKSGKHAN